jgi:hypothetical protein
LKSSGFFAFFVVGYLLDINNQAKIIDL